VVATVVGIWYVRRYKLPTWRTADSIAPGIALGHVVGRFGCVLAGCCYGRPTSLPWGITFSDPFAALNVGTPLHVALHPTQLYDAGAELLILVFLLATERRGRQFAGRTFWLYMLLYAVTRFAVEFFRGDPRGMLGGFATSQVIALVLAPLSVLMLVVLARRGATAPAAGATLPPGGRGKKAKH
jgi:phosphatidylglycerol:prolipoprotein diacylglycerol transferase